MVNKDNIDSKNKIVREKANINQWRKTDTVVTRFKNIENKLITLFIKFDTVDFHYPTSKYLSINAINFGKSITPID